MTEQAIEVVELSEVEIEEVGGGYGNISAF